MHAGEGKNHLAAAISRVAPVYAMDARTGELCRLTEDELDGAAFRKGATALALKDGTTIASVSITRGDLRHAVAVLKSIGFRPEPQTGEADARPAAPASFAAPLTELVQLLSLPLAPAYIEKVNRLAMEIVRAASSGPVVNHAMQLISALHHARVQGHPRSNAVDAAFAALQQAIEKARA
jgi:hypothetical protein